MLSTLILYILKFKEGLRTDHIYIKRMTIEKVIYLETLLEISSMLRGDIVDRYENVDEFVTYISL